MPWARFTRPQIVLYKRRYQLPDKIRCPVSIPEGGAILLLGALGLEDVRNALALVEVNVFTAIHALDSAKGNVVVLVIHSASVADEGSADVKPAHARQKKNCGSCETSKKHTILDKRKLGDLNR